MKKSFASDNNSGVHPEVMRALAQANTGHAVGYGDDEYTRRAKQVFGRHFGDDIDVYFVFLGTAANVLGLKTMAASHQAVVCAESAHANVDECGAPENFIGCKLLPIPGENGKIRPKHIAPLLHSLGFEHHSQPRVVSVTQCTELGAVYTLEELRALADFAHENNMLLHMDGARLANATAFLDVSLREASRDAGVDVLSFGGTKNGMMYGEAVVFFNTALSREFKYIRKQGMQLASKMRYISAQFEAMLAGDLWLENARKANAMARLLADGLKDFPRVRVSRPVETNAVFAVVPPEIIKPLRQEYFFYEWDPMTHEVRWMASFDTTEEDVRGFLEALGRVL